MKLLVLGINYDPEIISTAVYSAGLAENMALAGVETHVVTAKPYYPAWRVFEGWRGWPFWRSRCSKSGVNIVHCPLYVPATPSGGKRILHHVSFGLMALPCALWKGLTVRPDIVFVVAPSMVSAPVGWLTARLGGAKAWLHIQDYEVEAAFATGLLREDSAVGRAAKAFERWVLRRFDRISSISRPMLDKLRQKNVAREKIYELRNWANLSKVVPMEEGASPLGAEFGIRTRHVALYSGNLANKQGLEIIPKMAHHLSGRDDLTFVVCGDGPMRRQLEAMAAGVPNIRFLPLQPLERLNELLGMASVHLLPQIAGAADLVLPSKLTNMLASGRPVLATADADTALAEEIGPAGVVVPPNDPEAAAQALASLLDDPKQRSEMGCIARQRAIDRWDMTAVLDQLRIEFGAISGTPQPEPDHSKTRESLR